MKYQAKTHEQNRGSYMSAHVLLNLLNKLWKSDKKQCLPSILSLFATSLKLFCKSMFWCENVNISLNIYAMLWTSFHHVIKICKPLVVYRFYCMVLYHSQKRHHVIKSILPKKDFYWYSKFSFIYSEWPKLVSFVYFERNKFELP